MTDEPTAEIEKIKQTSALIADLITAKANRMLDKMTTSEYPFQAAKMAEMQMAFGPKVIGQRAQHERER